MKIWFSYSLEQTAARSLFGAALVLVLLAGYAANADEPPQNVSRDTANAIPPVLLAAPLNATWAANHVDYWRETGFSGFIFEGIFDAIGDPRWAASESPPEAFGHPLLEEIRLAQVRLKENGIPNNFLRLAFSPGDACLANPVMREAAIQAFSRAGVFCRRSGLRGIALDTRAEDPAYWKQWDGYAAPEVDKAKLANAARALGKSILRAFIRACPEGELLIFVPGTDTAGPLWFSLLDGMIASVGAADSIPIEVMAAIPADCLSEDELWRRYHLLQRTIDLCLGEESLSIWKRQGGVGLGLTPLGIQQGIAPAEFLGPGVFQRQLAAAKLLSKRYAWVDAPDGGWWYIAAEEVAQYAALRQNGRAAVMETTILCDPIWDYAKGKRKDFVYGVRQAMDSFQRVGSLPGYETPPTWAWVLRKENEAALLAWNPQSIFSSKEYGGAASSYRLKSRALPCWITPLETGDRQPVKIKDDLEIPIPDTPIFMEGLPLAEWGMSAALSITSETPLAPGSTAAPLELRYTHPLPLTLDATLECAVPNDPAADIRTFHVHIKQGETVRLPHTVRGSWRLGATQTFQLSLLMSGGGVVHREAAFPVWPALKSEYWCGVPLAGGPAVSDLDGDTREEIVWCDVDGGLAAMRPNGDAIWRQVSPVPFQVGPVALPKGGRGLVAVCDAAGQLQCLDGEGHTVFSVLLSGAQSPQVMLSAVLAKTSWVIAGMGEGRVVAVEPRAGRVWEHVFKGPLLALGEEEDLVVAMVQEDEPVLFVLDAGGNLRWQTALPPVSVVRPFLGVLPGATPTMVVSTVSGEFQHYDADTGRLLDTFRLGGPVAVQCASICGQDLLAGTDCGLYCIGTNGALRWDMGGWGISAVAWRRAGGSSMVFAASERGGWMGVNSDGILQWEENRALGPIVGTPYVGDVDADGRLECVYASADRAVRVIALDLGSPLPPRIIRGVKRLPGSP